MKFSNPRNEYVRANASKAKSSKIWYFKKSSETDTIQQEMRQALRKLGLSEDGPNRRVNSLAIAPWFQILMEKRRMKSLTPEDAKDLGSAVTASLTQLILKRGEQMIDIKFKPEKMVF